MARTRNRRGCDLFPYLHAAPTEDGASQDIPVRFLLVEAAPGTHIAVAHCLHFHKTALATDCIEPFENGV
eukprot:scaffold249_cov405-Prasinococcus_capsulatus_cf.AAC.6